MTEFLHQVVANRDYIQNDRELHLALRNALNEGWSAIVNTGPWALRNEENNGEL